MAAPGEAIAGSLAGFAQAQLQQKIGYLLTLALIVAIGIGAWMWSSAPDYRPLYGGLTDRDGGAVVAALQQLNVPYKVGDAGTVLVPATHVHEARLKLAAQGLPKGASTGFELLETQRFGVSQFLEQVNYQRALEGELARSIQAVAAVSNARVHLAIARPSAFVRDQQKSSASVLVNLYPGRGLDQQQVSAIVHLVSNSVPDLPSQNVTVVDQSGQLLSTPGGKRPLGLDPQQLRYVQTIETTHTKRIEEILAPIVGPGNVRAQVTADVDFSENERVEEIHKPNQNPDNAVVRSQQSSESTNSGGAGTGGVPGALSNQAPAPAQAPVTAPAGQQTGTAAQQGPVSARKDSTVNYEVDRTINHVRQQVGTIKRLSVAVVVNYRSEKGPDGKVTQKPLTDDERKQITDLVREVIGFNKDRGDTLNVMVSPFSTPEREPAPEVPFWQAPENITLAKEVARQLMIAGIALYVVFGVLRPMLRSFAPPPAPEPPEQEPQALPSPDSGPEGSQGDGVVVNTATNYDASLANARAIAKQDPKLVANIVKSWVQPDGR